MNIDPKGEYLQLIDMAGKLFVALIVGTASICASIAGTYYSLIRRLDRQDSDREITNLKLQTLQAQVDKIEIEVKELKEKAHRLCAA